MSVDMEGHTDIVELCALLKCLGFSVKSMDKSDGNISQDGGIRTIVVNCQSSGLHVVLESGTTSCSCPVDDLHTSSIWQVSGVAGGKQLDKQCGSNLLGSLPRSIQERLTRELQEMMLSIKQHNESVTTKMNKSASMVDFKTSPEKGFLAIKHESPSRYRSLDTLINMKPGGDPALPAPGPLTKRATAADTSMDDEKNVAAKEMCRRQSTYTLRSFSGSTRRRNKTSSPIQTPQSSIYESLLSAKKTAEDLQNQLAEIVSGFSEEAKDETSISSLVLDVSKISVLKGCDSKSLYASSPNLSALGTLHEDHRFKNPVKRVDSASTSNLMRKPATKETGLSKIRRLSPNFFGMKKTTSGSGKADKSGKLQDSKTAKTNMIKPRIVTPLRTTKPTDSNPILSSSKKKFDHIKSTIPRPQSMKKP